MTMRRAVLAMAFLVSFVHSFSTITSSPKRSLVILSAHEQEFRPQKQLSQFMFATAVFLSAASSGVVMGGAPAYADEFGVETEAPTLFTGETVMICKKRGPLGACLETEARTAENDNDKASKYFRDPSTIVKDKEAEMRASADTTEEGNALIAKLRQQTQDNKEKNDLLVKQKTAQADQGASFGPFDRQTPIMNEDGKAFTLLENPQAMRLKKAGYIKDRRFVKQPTQEVLDDALESPDDGIGGMIKGFFGDKE